MLYRLQDEIVTNINHIRAIRYDPSARKVNGSAPCIIIEFADARERRVWYPPESEKDAKFDFEQMVKEINRLFSCFMH